MRKIEGPKSLAVVCLNAAFEDASPKGTCILFLTSMFKEGELLSAYTAENKRALTTRVAEQLIDETEKALGISLKDHIEELFIADPIDVAGNMLAYDGMMYGYEQTVTDSVLIRSRNLMADNCIGNLLFAGATAQNGHGYGAAIRVGNIMGELAAAQIKEETK